MYYHVKFDDNTVRGIIEATVLMELLRKLGFKSVGKAPTNLETNWGGFLVSTHDKKFAVWSNVSAGLQAKAKEIPIAQIGQALLEELQVEKDTEECEADHSIHLAIMVSGPGYKKPVAMDMCITCMRKAVAGSEEHIQMYSNPHVVRMLLAEFLRSKGITVEPDAEADAKLAEVAFDGDGHELMEKLHAELKAQ